MDNAQPTPVGPFLTKEVVLAPLQALLEWAKSQPAAPRDLGPMHADVIAQAAVALSKLHHMVPSVDNLLNDGDWAPYFNPMSSALNQAQTEGWRNHAVSPQVTEELRQKVDTAVGELFCSLAPTEQAAANALHAFRAENAELLTQALEAAQDDGCNHHDCVTTRTEELDIKLHSRIRDAALRLASKTTD